MRTVLIDHKCMSSFLGLTSRSIKITISFQFRLFNSQGLLRVTCRDRLDVITYFVLYFSIECYPEIEMVCSSNLPDAPIAISE